jgi:hypothetical protein
MKKFVEGSKPIGKRMISALLCVLLAALCVITVPQLSTKASARIVVDKNITGLGTGAIGNPIAPGEPGDTSGWTGSYVYYGTYSGDVMKYRVLDKDATEFGGNTMLLDCDSIITDKYFYFDATHVIFTNVWNDSDIKTWLNGNEFYGDTDVFSVQEKGAIASSVKGLAVFGDGNGSHLMGYAPLTGEHIFLLDAKEATRTSYGYANALNGDENRSKSVAESSSWWLRSPELDDPLYAGSVETEIQVNFVDGVPRGVSPAFNLDLQSIIFSSLVSGTEGSVGAEYKLTIKDADMTIAQTEDSDVTREGNVVTVPYTITGSNADTATRVSVLLTDNAYSAGTAVTSGYNYQELSVSSWGTSGTGTFTLPSEYEDKICGTDYYAYILAENVNSAYSTDYASVPTPISVPAVSGGSSGPVTTPIVITVNTSEGEQSTEGNSSNTEKDWLEIVDDAIDEAIKKGDSQTIYLWGVTGLPVITMRKLKDNPQITLVLNYTYENVEYNVTIPGKNVVVDDTIPWYGPLYLNKYYS